MSDATSCEGEFTVRSSYGLHARPAARFAQVAADSGCEIELGRAGGDEWVNGASVLSILSLAAAEGTKLVVRVEGPDAQGALADLGALIEDDEAG